MSGESSTRIEGPRSRRVRFSTGRAAELRAVPNFRAMLSAGEIDAHDLADLQSVLAGELEATRIDARVEEAILRHVFLDPLMPELYWLDETEITETIAFSIRAYLEASAPQIVEPELDDDEADEASRLAVEDDEPAEAALEDLPVPVDEALATAEAALPDPGELPGAEGLGAE